LKNIDYKTFDEYKEIILSDNFFGIKTSFYRYVYWFIIFNKKEESASSNITFEGYIKTKPNINDQPNFPIKNK
jgi:hypothetical protein